MKFPYFIRNFSKQAMCLGFSIALSSSLLSGCANNNIRQYSKHSQTETLLENLNSSDKKLRVDTINALGKMRDPRSINALSQRLKSDNWVEREAVVNALAGINDYLVIEPLFTALSDNEQFVREAAQKALQEVVVRLGKKRDPRMIKQIVNELSNKRSQVRRTAAKLLRTAVRSLHFVDPQEYLKYILSGTTSKNRYVRLASVVILREIDDQSIYTPLVVALDDPAREVRNAAVESLMLLDKPDSTEPIMKAMADDNPFVRINAAKLIRKYNQGSAEGEGTDVTVLLRIFASLPSLPCKIMTTKKP
ncbi:MAG: HEAT repeat domain-containing protein [Thiohalomonadales bacterium]